MKKLMIALAVAAAAGGAFAQSGAAECQLGPSSPAWCFVVGVNYLGRSATTILAGLRRGSCRRSCRQVIFGFPGAAACAARLR